MTTGIYKLNFTHTDKVYIGKSKNIEKRYLGHTLAMRKGYAAKKVQEAFHMYGIPAYEILCECASSDLHIFEHEAIEIFNSVNCGFNTKYADEGEGCTTLIGEKGVSALYSNDTYIEIAELLATTNLTVLEISKELFVSKNVVSQIKQIVNHAWLKDEVPEYYNKIKEKLFKYRQEGNSASYSGIFYTSVISPNNIEFNVECVNKFAREHKLDSGNLSRLLNKEYTYYKGWRLSTTPVKPVVRLISPKGELVILKNISILQFSKQNNLDNSTMSKVVKGTVSQHKGWKLCTE